MALTAPIQNEIVSEAPARDAHEWFDFVMATTVDGQEIPK